MSIHQFENEGQWAEARRRYVTSTEVSALFGQNPRLTAFELYHLKKNPALDTFEGTERTEWGNALQHAIGSRVATKYGVHIKRLDLQLAIYCAGPEPYALAASGDFMITGTMPESWWRVSSVVNGTPRLLAEYVEKYGPGVLEIKNVDSLIYKNEWTEQDMPDQYEIQLQAEMLCWDTKWGVVAALVGGNRLEIYVRLRDEEVCDLIKQRSRSFMNDFYKEKAPPPIMPQDAGMVIALHQYAEPNKVYDGTEDAYLLTLLTEYKEHSAIIDRSTKARESIKATIFSRIGDAERVINCGSYNVSASVRPPCEIAAHTRAGFRGLNITVRKAARGRKDEVRSED